MIADLKPYAEYKESGLPWLGMIPRHWSLQKLKHITRFVNGFPFKPVAGVTAVFRSFEFRI